VQLHRVRLQEFRAGGFAFCRLKENALRRVISRELLDDDRGDPGDLQTSLDDLWRINRWLGGISGSMRLFGRFFARAGLHPIRILDVGTGDGRAACYVAEKLQRRCPNVRTVILDRRLSHLRNGRVRRLGTPVAADALTLPFPPGSFEVVTCNLFLHHFSGKAARALLGSLLAVASEAVLINDLERKRLAYWLIGHLPWIARSPITRLDGRASVRQAYSKDELLALAREAGAAEFEVMRLPFYRLGLLMWK
jgi:SAM-dependent methyltransferase